MWKFLTFWSRDKLKVYPLGQKKYFPKTKEIGRVKIFYHSPSRIVKYVSEYIFLITKNKKQTKN